MQIAASASVHTNTSTPNDAIEQAYWVVCECINCSVVLSLLLSLGHSSLIETLRFWLKTIRSQSTRHARTLFRIYCSIKSTAKVAWLSRTNTIMHTYAVDKRIATVWLQSMHELRHQLRCENAKFRFEANRLKRTRIDNCLFSNGTRWAIPRRPLDYLVLCCCSMTRTMSILFCFWFRLHRSGGMTIKKKAVNISLPLSPSHSGRRFRSICPFPLHTHISYAIQKKSFVGIMCHTFHIHTWYFYACSGRNLLFDCVHLPILVFVVVLVFFGLLLDVYCVSASYRISHHLLLIDGTTCLLLDFLSIHNWSWTWRDLIGIAFPD